MSMIDELAEKHILKAIEQGAFDHLPGKGKPLVMENDHQVPEHLKAGYKILKNAGFLPPELEQRKQALVLVDLLEHVEKDSEEYALTARQLQTLELKMQLAGMSTHFLKSRYRQALIKAMAGDVAKPII